MDEEKRRANGDERWAEKMKNKNGLYEMLMQVKYNIKFKWINEMKWNNDNSNNHKNNGI